MFGNKGVHKAPGFEDFIKILRKGAELPRIDDEYREELHSMCSACDTVRTARTGGSSPPPCPPTLTPCP
eukprot:COSAG05_NODE_1245_length_5413_cov_6.208129_7_plen_69_part_00